MFNARLTRDCKCFSTPTYNLSVTQREEEMVPVDITIKKLIKRLEKEAQENKYPPGTKLEKVVVQSNYDNERPDCIIMKKI